MLQIQKPVWKSHFIPEIYDGSRIKRGGGGGGIVAYSQRRIPSTLLTICGLKLRQLSDGYRKSIKMLE